MSDDINQRIVKGPKVTCINDPLSDLKRKSRRNQVRGRRMIYRNEERRTYDTREEVLMTEGALRVYDLLVSFVSMRGSVVSLSKETDNDYQR